MLIEGREGTYDIKSLYKQFNKQHFGGSLPNIKVQWSGRLHNAIGRAHVVYKGQRVSRSLTSLINKYSETIPVAEVEIDLSSLRITISSKVDLSVNDIKAVMLHEMVHIKLYTERKLGGHHGTPEFDGWIKKLRAETGLDIPFKESSFKRSPKIKGKDGFVMLLTQTDGKYGVATFTISWMNNNWFIFAETMTRIMNQSGRIQKLEYFRINHRVINDYPARRSLRKISWTIVDEETAMEIRKKGKQWGESYIGGGRISPHTVGMKDKELLPLPIELDKRGKAVNLSDVLRPKK